MSIHRVPFADIVNYEGTQYSLRTVRTHRESNYVHLSKNNIGAETALMVIDKSDTVNWPHSNTGHIELDYIDVMFDPDTSYAGDITLGFLSNVDDTDGDLNAIHVWHYERQGGMTIDHLTFNLNELSLETAKWFGPTIANNTNFQTDVNIEGPDNNVSYPCGDGDLVLLITRTAGYIDISLTAGYNTVV